ncbi:MAG: hypothetical protein JWM32_375 [Verrucomicrobia bacterium]|nr:hypothetical protein [Verrucomicrobiota bacterium]
MFRTKNPEFRSFMRHRFVLLTLASLVVLAGCREPKVASYRIPKEKPPEPPMSGSNAGAPAAGADMANTAVPTANGTDLTWTAPAQWTAKPAAAMRKGSYAVTGENGATADLSITAFPGDVGGELANLNRWRGQIQLPPLQEADLPGVTTRAERNGLTFITVDFAGTSPNNPQRILGAIVPFNGATWFFKLTGPDALVAKEKNAFLAFLETVRAPASP